MRNLYSCLFIAVTATILNGCASHGGLTDDGIAESLVAPAATEQQADEKLGVSSQLSSSSSNEEPSSERGSRLFPGSDSGVALPPPAEPLTLWGDAVSINFEEAPLDQVVHSVLGDTLGLDYIVEHPIQGQITLRSRSPIPRDQLLPIMEALLLNNGVVMVRGPDDRFFLSRAGAENTMSPSFSSPQSAIAGFSNVIVPLQHISASEMAEILQPVAPDTAFVRVDTKRNLLILAGTQLQLSGWLDIVATFDIDQLAGTSVGVFPIKRAKVEDVHREVMHILRTTDGKEGVGISSIVSVMPVKRLNSILVVSPRATYVERIGAWIGELDSMEGSDAESQLHVYRVENGDAANIAALLRAIYGSGGQGSLPSSEVAPGMTAQRTSSSGGGMSSDMPSRGGSRGGGGGSFQLGETVRVVSDPQNNVLLVHAPAYEYAEIERILKKLDVIATQVLIEASIVEVTLTDDLQYGLEWTFQNGIGSDYLGTGSLNLNGGDIGPLAPGFAYTVSNQAGAFKAVLNALAEKSLVNVISTPSVLVLDNHTAAIHVGFQQPIQSRQSVTDGGVSQTSIEYKDTGVKLEVTPSVNDGGLVTLDVIQSVTDVGPVDTATEQRSFLERNVSSRVAIRDGESVVLGGLIRDNSTQGKSGVPLLMDIPVLGNLFSTTADNTTRTELLIFITPRVLESDEDLMGITREMKQRMRGLKDFSDLPEGLSDGIDS